MVVYKISFAKEYVNRGFAVILGAGPGRIAGSKDEFWVTEVALRKLDERRIPYEILVGKEKYSPVQRH